MSNTKPTPTELLHEFIAYLQNPEATKKKAISYLTKTQQHNQHLVRSSPVEPNLNGMQQVFLATTEFSMQDTTKNKNKPVRDYMVRLKTKTRVMKYSVRMICETEAYKPNIDGVWGININSFIMIH